MLDSIPCTWLLPRIPSWPQVADALTKVMSSRKEPPAAAVVDIKRVVAVSYTHLDVYKRQL